MKNNCVSIRECYQRHEELTETINRRFEKLEQKVTILIFFVILLIAATLPQLIKLISPQVFAKF